MPTIKISVVMTVYNSEKYVAEAIKSILDQTFTDFEFIIVDDASTDRTAEIIRSFSDPRIRYFRNETNMGQTVSLNFGISQSQTDYIARMDADDISVPKRLQEQFNFLERNSSMAVVGSWRLDINEEGIFVRAFRAPADPFDIRAFMAGSGDLSFWVISHPTVMMRKKAVLEVGGYNQEEGKGAGYPQDYELWPRLLLKYDFANIPEFLLKYRLTPQSDSKINEGRQVEARNAISLRKIKHFSPAFTESQRAILLEMLEYRRQKSSADGRKVFELFDRYFYSYMGEKYDPKAVIKRSSQLKYYYLPRLFRTNPFLAIRWWGKLVAHHPLFLFDGKFYRKIGKCLSR